jgi:hypothetical protein
LSDIQQEKQILPSVISHSQPGYDFSDWAQRLDGRVTFFPREIVLEMAMRLCYLVEGNIVEFGVAKGGSIKPIRQFLTQLESQHRSDNSSSKRIFGFDSFKGLPEKFEKAKVGAFACSPPSIDGVNIVEGLFEQTLTSSMAEEVGKISFAHFDADLYSSTITALHWLTPLVHSGSLLLFDEFLAEKQSELRAFGDWSRETGVETVMIAEFMREPAAWGSITDKRVLFQVL